MLKAVLFPILGLGLSIFVAPPALAGLPDPAFCTIDPVIVSTRSQAVGFHAIVRDITQSPHSHKPVTIDFSATNVRLDAVQSSGVTVNCAVHTITATTDQDGALNIGVSFSGYSNDAVIVVSIEGGVVLKLIRARSTDFDGGAGLSDLSHFSELYATTHPEADFDDSGGAIGLGDLSIFAREYSLRGTPCP